MSHRSHLPVACPAALHADALDAGRHPMRTCGTRRLPFGFVGRFATAAVVLAFLLGGEAARAQTAVTWQGTAGAANQNWSAGGNWSATPATSGTYSLLFNNATRPTNNNNLGGLVLTNVTFGTNAGAFTISGSAVTLRGIISNSSANNQAISFNILLGGTAATSGTFQAASAEPSR